MKLISLVCIAGLLFGAHTAYGCDEACQKEAAETKNSVKFPGYLTWRYCDDLKLDFIETDMKSLQSYSSKHFNTKYKGPIKNTIKFLSQRKEWLQECDRYLGMTRKDRIFHDTKTTKLVFNKMDSINTELKDIINGVTYSSSQGDETKVIVGEKFNALFRAIDDHKNLMHLKGKYVYQ